MWFESKEVVVLEDRTDPIKSNSLVLNLVMKINRLCGDAQAGPPTNKGSGDSADDCGRGSPNECWR